MAELRYLDKKSVFILLILLCLAGILTSCSTACSKQNLENMVIENHLKECIEIHPKEIKHKEGAVYLAVKIKYIENIGYCGCKSALLSYKVSAINKSEKIILRYGEFSSLNQEEFDFLVCNDSKQQYDFFTIDIQCKNPD